MAYGRSSPGKIRPTLPARVWNSMIDAGLAHAAQRNDTPTPLPPYPHIIKIKNTSGGSLSAGAVVQYGATSTGVLEQQLLTAKKRANLWFKGITPTKGRNHAVLLGPLRPNAIGEAITHGPCMARVNITNTAHAWANFKSGQAYLESEVVGGQMRLLSKTTSTGVQDALVDFRQIHTGIFSSRGALTPMSGNADIPFAATVYANYGGIVSKTNSTTVKLLWPGIWRVDAQIWVEEMGAVTADTVINIALSPGGSMEGEGPGWKYVRYGTSTNAPTHHFSETFFAQGDVEITMPATLGNVEADTDVWCHCWINFLG